jgi:hypothetical protein
MSENLGGFRSSPAGFAGGLLTFPGIRFIHLFREAAHGDCQRRRVAAGMNPAANATR